MASENPAAWAGRDGPPNTFVFEVTAIHRRSSPLIFVDDPGAPINDQAQLLTSPRSALIERRLQQAGLANIVGVWTPPELNGQAMTVVAVRQSYAGHATQAMHLAAQSSGSGLDSAFAVVVDDDIDIYNLDDVLWALLTRCDPDRDMTFIRRLTANPQDRTQGHGPASPSSLVTIDATKPWEWIDGFAEAINSPEGDTRARDRWGWILNPTTPDPRNVVLM